MSTEIKEKKSIKDWAADDRPREKMMAKGKSALSDAELIAILIGSGNSKKSAVELSREILQSVKSNLIELSKQSIGDLMKHQGIGEAKAISIIAALELGNRRRYAEALELPTIKSSKQAYEYLYANIPDFTREQFLVLMLNQGNRIIKIDCISTGGLTGTVADPKVIFKNALDCNATAIILCHNHPSGEVNPSQDDIFLTKK
jgi:DNA repair protein radc